MKTVFQNSFKYIIVALFVCIGLRSIISVSSVNAQSKAESFQSGLLEENTVPLITNFVQTQEGTTTTSIGMSWAPVENAVTYAVFQDKKLLKGVVPADKNSFVITTSNKAWHKFTVAAYDADNRLCACSNSVEMKVGAFVPNAVTGFDIGYTKDGTLASIWNEQADCDAYEVVAYNNNGIPVDEKEITPILYPQNATYLDCPIGKLYQVRIRAINKDWNGEILASDWSAVKYICIPKSFKTKLKSRTSKNRTVITSWKKVSGVTTYTLSGSTSKESGYKKIKSLSSKKKMKVTYSKIRGKKFVYEKNYYVRLRMKAKVKLDGKRSTHNFDAYRIFHITNGLY